VLNYVAVVDRGLVHETNDDTLLLGHTILSNGKLEGKFDDDEGIFGVADGVGGLRFSELASREALRNLSECSARNREELIERIKKANSRILEIRNKRKLFPDISSTLCITAILEEKLITYNLGNSRSYRFRDGILLQLTKDQTKVQSLCDAGIINTSEMKSHAESNIITAYIGTDDFMTDWIDVTEHREKYKCGDIILMCSDGLSDYVDIEVMEQVLSLDISLGEKADEMLKEVYKNGAGDNISFILVEKK
jgi:protein phosphatase